MSERTLFRTTATRRFDGGASDADYSPVRRAHWAIVLAALGFVISGVAWSILGSATASVEADGYVLPRSGLHVVVSPFSGVVTAMHVAPGDILAVGDPVARVDRDGAPVETTALVAGTVEAVERAPGDWIDTGQNLVVIRPDDPLVVYAFVAIDQATLVAEGMPVQVSFAAHPAAQYGTVPGTVAEIAELVSTPGSLDDVFHDQALIDAVVALGPVIRMVIAVDAAELDEFSRRSAVPIRLAAPVSVRILIEVDSPIEHLLG